MVVKTELCAFSEYRIYPGHGLRFVRRDGQPVIVSTSKCKSMVLQRKKPAKLMWTQAWRRLNKKGKEDGIVKKKAKKAVKVQRAIVGASLEELKKKRMVTRPKNEATEAALKEVKERQKTAVAGKKPSIAVGGGKKPIIPKSTQQPSRGNTRGSQR
mmetsp:Transcript_4027/g.4118  ORF Transcript_4027/g.4118 Transcript_4027/m.4118 type:complete len:156 (+) Transcript_4027:83-550(+)|eukprot:CAMPEP_0182426764 /NCGR_PEP_ID=MMETSP1167-20130531/13284_1 /TAXON_ID=2988 /ORGANISM="Mallomonas Sp, Strain CCMP3275" /LENGTH=155 /DNA_ID=CAMNT_0024608437 /DNA_START=82 /DNA_END=549 /DNA_ORIENTATION=+